MYALVHCVSIIPAPFYHVRFPDFFIGDQMTSHNQSLIDLLRIIINIATRPIPPLSSSLVSFLNLHDKYNDFSATATTLLRFIPNVVPSLIRLLQCIRRYRDEKQAPAVGVTSREFYPHMSNGIKYFMSLVAMCFFWNNACYAVLQFLYTLYALNWDLREDWGGGGGEE